MSLNDEVELLGRPVRKLVIERFGTLTEPQKLAIPRILRGENVLLMAPTGTGKTEAALLPVLNLMLSEPQKNPILTLYITPLRALNRDLLDRVEWWCQRLDVSVAVRHGDTSSRERRAQALYPPHMLIITPEALQSLLVGKVMRRYLRNVRWVIVDEVHELASDKRGSQLSIALRRLRAITGRDFQLIGLSATVGSSEEVAKFLVGRDGKCTILRVPVARDMSIKVVFPQPEEIDKELSEELGVVPDVAARLRVIKELVEQHSSTLIFTNTRPLAEVLANRFKAWSETFPVSIHHGSLAREQRLRVEKDLKEGELSGIICTSSLEMGIDIGRVDLCIQYNSPREVSRLIQRVGRSGHKIGRVSKGVVVVTDSDDALEAMVIVRRTMREELEPTPIPRNNLDALMHQLAGLLIENGSIKLDDVLGLVRGSFNYAELPMEELVEVAKFMDSIGVARYSEVSRSLAKPGNNKRLYHYYFNNLSMIPEEKQYLVVNEENGEPVGILDEEFIAEYGEPGTRFILAGKAWVILSMSGERVYVAPLSDGEGAVPSWVGDEIPVPFKVASEVGFIRRLYVEMRREEHSHEEVVEKIASMYNADSEDVSRSLRELAIHYELNIPIPHDKKVVVEKAGEYTIVHVHGGLKINRTIARALAVDLAEKIGAPIHLQSDPYRVVLRSPHIDPYDVVDSLERVVESGEELIEKSVESSGIFKRRLIHTARKMGVIEREASIVDVSVQQLVESLKGTPVYKEALRYTVFNDFDKEGALSLLRKIVNGEVELEIYVAERPTPLAALTINRYMYEAERHTPERLHRVIISAVRGRLMSEKVHLICTDCKEYQEDVEVGSLEAYPECPFCNSKRVGIIKSERAAELALDSSILRQTSKADKKLLRNAEKTATLVERYGKAAVIALVGRGLTLKDAEDILNKEPNLSPHLIELIIEAEKKRMLELYR